MSDSIVVYALYHIYDEVIDGIISRESKRIGFFETRSKCIEIIEEHRAFEGFRDHPKTCFKIFEYEIGKSYWRDEFLF